MKNKNLFNLRFVLRNKNEKRESTSSKPNNSIENALFDLQTCIDDILEHSNNKGTTEEQYNNFYIKTKEFLGEFNKANKFTKLLHKKKYASYQQQFVDKLKYLNDSLGELPEKDLGKFDKKCIRRAEALSQFLDTNEKERVETANKKLLVEDDNALPDMPIAEIKRKAVHLIYENQDFRDKAITKLINQYKDYNHFVASTHIMLMQKNKEYARNCDPNTRKTGNKYGIEGVYKRIEKYKIKNTITKYQRQKIELYTEKHIQEEAKKFVDSMDWNTLVTYQDDNISIAQINSDIDKYIV